jgi:DNA-binding beta-propeller fold protein YncE
MRPQHVPPPEVPGPYEFAAVIGRPAATGAGFLFPLDLVVDEAERLLYVVCRQQPRVSRWSLDGDYVDQFGHPGSVVPEGRPGLVGGELFWPAGIALDAQRAVYVTEEGPHRVQKLTATGQFVAKWGSNGVPDRLPLGGSRHGQFSRPSGVAVGPDQSVYVVDALNHRVQRFTAEGRFLGQWGTFGAGEGQLDTPWGIAVDAGQGWVYVSDWRNDRLQRFDLDGRFLAVLGRSGSGPGELRRPAGVAVDGAGNVAVADWGNDRVQVLAPAGAPLAVLTGHGDRLSQVARVFMDARDDLVRQRAEAGGGHPLEPYFWAPAGVAFDSAGTLYAADTLRHRVQVYRRRPEGPN